MTADCCRFAKMLAVATFKIREWRKVIVLKVDFKNCISIINGGIENLSNKCVLILFRTNGQASVKRLPMRGGLFNKKLCVAESVVVLRIVTEVPARWSL